jgi:3-oxoadipate enol-lactonase
VGSSPAGLVDIGSGPPLVLIPGVQGRWEYVRPAVDALATSFRVLTFSLCGERGVNRPFNPALGFDNYARQVEDALDRSGIDRAVICGISFGGLAAIRFAATRAKRTTALVLVSTPGPGWHLRSRHRTYARVPWLFLPLFLAETPLRLRVELASTFPRRPDRWRFAQSQLRTLARAPLSAKRMAIRATLIDGLSLPDECQRITSPTLVVTGERALDRVVPVDGTIAYLRLIEGSDHQVLPRTGHLGSITRPAAFGSLVRAFVDRRTAASRHEQYDATA